MSKMPVMPRSLVMMATCLALLTPASAYGQSKAKKKRARGFYKKGDAAFKAERYDEALNNFEKAYELYPVRALLFNIGQSHLFLEEYEEAIDAFAMFKKGERGEKAKADVDRLIADCRREIDAREAREAEAAAAAVVPPPKAESAAGAPPELPKPTLEPPQSAAQVDTAVAVAPKESAGPAVYETWWFWTIVGGVALAAGGGALIATQSGTTTTILPSGTLGVLDRRNQ